MTEGALPFVSVVVPAHNAARTIEACVRSLLAQDYPRDRHEILVVDNRSTDDTARIVADLPVRLVSERERQSSYAARNRGAREAKGEWLAFTDADCVAQPDWLRLLLAGHDSPSIAGLAGRVLPVEPAGLLEAFAVARGQVSQDVTMANSFLPAAITANVAYRRSVWEALGGFDETMISSGDMNFAWRMQLLHGWTIRFNRDAVVRHKHRVSFRAFWKQHRVYGFGTAMLYDQFPGYAKSLRREAVMWLRRSLWFSGRGLVRLVCWPFRWEGRPRPAGHESRGGLYVAQHFLEVLCTTSRLLGMVQYRWVFRGRRPAPVVTDSPGSGSCDRGRAPTQWVADGSAEDRRSSARVVAPRHPLPAVTVSVVIPAYNRAHLLGPAIESVLAQTYKDLEVIVVDDGSTDETAAVAQRYAAQPGGRVRVIRQANQGVSAARNSGCRAARGRYIALLDSDDLWKPEKLARQVPALEHDPGVGMVCSMADIVDADNQRVLGLKPRQRPGATLRELVRTGSAAPSTFVFRREALEEVGGFDPQIQGLEDLDFCFRLVRRWKIVCLEAPLIRYRQHGTGLSSDVAGICRAYIRTYEKLLALPDAEIPRAAVRQRLAKYHYQLGTIHARRRESRAAAAQLIRAIRTSPLVGLNFATARHGWWQRGLLVVKPYAAAAGVGCAAVFARNGHR